jgi:hypothetical protein
LGQDKIFINFDIVPILTKLSTILKPFSGLIGTGQSTNVKRSNISSTTSRTHQCGGCGGHWSKNSEDSASGKDDDSGACRFGSGEQKHPSQFGAWQGNARIDSPGYLPGAQAKARGHHER